MDWDAAEKTLLEIAAQSQSGGAVGWTDSAPELCALYAARGDWEQAYLYAKQISHPMHEDEPLLPFNLTGWYETEALLRGGEDGLARAGVTRLAAAVGDNRRYRLILLRSQAVLAQWDGDRGHALGARQAALVQEIGLPGEAWPILGELGRLYAEMGEQKKARAAYAEVVAIVRRLADTITEEDLRARYLASAPVQSILAQAEPGG